MILALLFMLSTSQAAPPTAPPQDVDQWIARAMRTFEGPGVALAIVKDDQVVVAKGYGVRKLGETTPVDPMGGAGGALPAGVRDVGSVRHPRADGPRPARAPQRARPWRRRSPVVAGIDLRPQGDRPPPAIHPAGHELPHRVRLRQRAVP